MGAAQQDQSRPELQERLLSVREKLSREQEAFEFHKRYSGEVEGDDKEDWAQNTGKPFHFTLICYYFMN
jgi:hypothetical protein